LHVPPQLGVLHEQLSVVHTLLSLQSSMLSQVTVMLIAGPRFLVTSLVGTPSQTRGLVTVVLLPAPKQGRSAIELVPPLMALNLIVLTNSPAVVAQPSGQLWFVPRNPRYRAFPSFKEGTPPEHGAFRPSPAQSLIQPENPPVPVQL